MGIASRILDRVILQPTRQPVARSTMARHVIKHGPLEFEVWIQDFDRYDAPRVNVLKLIGAGARAEHSSLDPLPLWHCDGQVWSVNPPGFGGSPGRASLANCVAAADAAAQTMIAKFPKTPLLVMGVSLGAALALHVAANHPVAAIGMRDVPDIRRIIRWRYGRFIVSWPAAATLAHRGVPAQLNSVANARRCTAPGIFVSARRDRIVPPHCQDKVIDAYSGERRVLHLPDSGHDQPISGLQIRDYIELQRWLKERVFG